jgi:hypothetical protein
MTTRAAIDFVAFANNVALHLPRGRSCLGACRGMSPKARLRMRPAGKERGPRGRGGVAATYVDAESGRSDAARRDAAVTAAGRISDRLLARGRADGPVSAGDAKPHLHAAGWGDKIPSPKCWYAKATANGPE